MFEVDESEIGVSNAVATQGDSTPDMPIIAENAEHYSYMDAALNAIGGSVETALDAAMAKKGLAWERSGMDRETLTKEAIVHVGRELRRSWDHERNTMTLDMEAIFETTLAFLDAKMREIEASPAHKKSLLAHVAQIGASVRNGFSKLITHKQPSDKTVGSIAGSPSPRN